MMKFPPLIHIIQLLFLSLCLQIRSHEASLDFNSSNSALASSTCQAPKPSVSVLNHNGSIREYTVGCNSWHLPLLDYLTEVIGNEFDPPISFAYLHSKLYMQTHSVEEALAMGYDFMVANAYASSCYETESHAVSVANQVVPRHNLQTGEFVNMTQLGAVLYVLRNRTDITSLTDIARQKNLKIGTNTITNLATHLCYDVLLRNGVHNLQDPQQTIFFRNSQQALEAVLEGKVDVGCAATSTLEVYTDPRTGQPLDVASQIRILSPQQPPVDDYPFAVSSDLVPGYQFMAAPHVEQAVQLRVQHELLAIREHADVAPALLACLQERGCHQNNTACLEACFHSLPPGTTTNCDTTPQLALRALKAMPAKIVGFSKPQNNLRVRDIQESTGFLLKERDNPQQNPRCVRMTNIVDAVTCPPGHSARTSAEILQQCNASGLECFGRDCICSPCVEAYEVDFFPLTKESKSGLGSGCSKFAICGQVQQEHTLVFRGIDNRHKQRPNATLTGAFLMEDETEAPFEFTKESSHGTYRFDFTASRMTAGQKTVKIRISGQEIPESPFRIVVLKRDCQVDTGHAHRVADEFGQCVCEKGTVEWGHRCVSLVILLPSLLVPAFILLLVAVHVYIQYQKQIADNVWKVDPSEVKFHDPPRVLGYGTFGLVVLAEYRGTSVAVKRVLPHLPEKKNKSEEGSLSRVMPWKLDSWEKKIEKGAIKKEGEETSRLEDELEKGAIKKNGKEGEERSGFMTQSPAATSNTPSKSLFATFLERNSAQKMKADFVKEMRLLSKLRHPSITTVMGAVLASSACEPMLLMEYMHFGSLYDLLHNESVVLEGKVLMGLLQDVASGLRFLHSSDPLVLHGDLKAHNILVDEKFRAKVADFGMSRKASGRKDRARGSSYWMAPELLRGETTNTKASDMYAMGIVMYEVFSRKEPYAGEEYEEVLRQVSCKKTNKRPPVPKKCPEEAAGMMKACWREDPSQRPTATDFDVGLRLMEASDIDTLDSNESWQTKKVEASRTDVLLEDMFPSHIAQALKEGRKLEPETHDEVTIVFSNIVGFTRIASSMSATKVSDLLDRLYSKFDELCERLEVFKVETIGDSYMTVTNLVKPHSHHTSLAAEFALEAIHVASKVPIDSDDPSAGFVQLRMGLHTGPVVTHVVGTKNSRFSLIGDTVNTACAMETHSEPGLIQCSDLTADLLAVQDPALNLRPRGLQHIKGKGLMMCYFLD